MEANQHCKSIKSNFQATLELATKPLHRQQLTSAINYEISHMTRRNSRVGETVGKGVRGMPLTIISSGI